MIDKMIAKARVAQAEYAKFSQEQVDEIVRSIVYPVSPSWT